VLMDGLNPFLQNYFGRRLCKGADLQYEAGNHEVSAIF
jgi:hypothetical protein